MNSSKRYKNKSSFKVACKKEHCVCKEFCCCECKESCRCECKESCCCECKEFCRCECKNKQCVHDLIESIALVETALAHILNAEGEKIQKAVQISKDINDLLEVNRSVNRTIINAIQLEQICYQKLDAVSELCRIEHDKSCEPCYPECPCHKPKPGTAASCAKTECSCEESAVPRRKG